MPQAGSQMVKSRWARGSGFMHAHDGLDEDARREVLPGALLAFARRLFEQPSKASAFTSMSSAVHSVSSIRLISFLRLTGLLKRDCAPAKMSPRMPVCLPSVRRSRCSGRSGRCRSARAASARRTLGSSTPRSSAILRKSR